MIKRSLLVFLIACVLTMPTFASAQTQSEAEYRAYLLTVIQSLQAQIEALQRSINTSSVTVKPTKINDDSFTSFLIEADDVVAQYEISNTRLVGNLSNKTHGTYFARFFTLVPDAYDDYFVDLLVFDGRGKEFDGFVETVPPYREDTWRIALNEDLFELPPTDSLFDELFVHEFAHVASYERVVGIPEPYQTDCHDYFSDFGCPPENSYLKAFMNTFWSNQDLDALADSEGKSIWTRRELKNQFVTEYASTDPAEDFAESFTFFILEPAPTGSLEKDEKVNFFYQFEELKKLRQEIQSKL